MYQFYLQNGVKFLKFVKIANIFRRFLKMRHKGFIKYKGAIGTSRYPFPVTEGYLS